LERKRIKGKDVESWRENSIREGGDGDTEEKRKETESKMENRKGRLVEVMFISRQYKSNAAVTINRSEILPYACIVSKRLKNVNKFSTHW